jgi:hypothetical protein
MSLLPSRALALAPALLALAVLAPQLTGQTGPFQSGEIIIMNPDSGYWKLLRVDPLTGDGEILIEPKYWGGWAGGMAYDSYRDALVGCFSMEPDAYWNYKPYAVSSDGSFINLPGVEGTTLSAMAPTGDGRIYFQVRNPASDEISFFDAGNQLHTLMDDTGAAPYLSKIEHLRYHAAGNALIATKTSWSGSGCNGPENTLYRIPLTPDGSQVAGPVSCVSFAQSQGYIMGLDELPGDLMLMTLAGWNQHDKLWIVDPVTLALSLYSEVHQVDLNGGVYCAPLGSAVVLEDFANRLQVHAQGSAGAYTELVVDIPIGDGTTGSSPAEVMVDIGDVAAPCAGFHQTYGAGLAGLGGFVPMLDATGCPDLGLTFSVVIDRVRGDQTGILFAGLGDASVPFKGGTFLVSNVGMTLALSFGGHVNSAGVGAVAIPVLLSDPAFVGLDLYAQGAFTDAAAVHGVSLTNGLQIRGY